MHDITLDRYGQTLLAMNYNPELNAGHALWKDIFAIATSVIPEINSFVLKQRFSRSPEQRNGIDMVTHPASSRVTEHEIKYALNLKLNRDSSFFLDTRILRAWLNNNSCDKKVLNTFAYTGSLGVAAQAGGAHQVVHTDLKRHFLNVAKTSYTLNGFPIRKANFIRNDFFREISRQKRAGYAYDIAIVDPPYFSSTQAGQVDLVNEAVRVLNKIRPLVNHGGRIVSVNNAIFLSGEQYLSTIQELCTDGYLELEQTIDIPWDYCGTAETQCRQLPVDPTPFNHATKIVILKVFKK